MVERIRQRGARPSENGTNPGGAAVLKTDVSKLTPAQCEELERRAMRGRSSLFNRKLPLPGRKPLSFAVRLTAALQSSSPGKESLSQRKWQLSIKQDTKGEHK